MEGGSTPSNEKGSDSPAYGRKNENRWIIGFSLLLVGAIFLFLNLTGWRFEKWWLLLLIIPCTASFVTALRTYRRRSQSKLGPILRPLALGLMFLEVMLLYLIGFEWQLFLAGFVILLGIVLLVGLLIKDRLV